jgi:protein-S-isoprenylcysteine O-methyltransferase Ste14
VEAIKVLTALLAYGAFHSATASTVWKARVAGLMGERAFLGLYRLFYSVISVLTLLPVVGLLARPGSTVWNAEGVTADALLAIRAMAGIGAAAALLQIDALRFLGIKEAIAYIRGRPLPLPPERLATHGVYRLVRHPLYLFSLIALWSSPFMTESFLGFALGATVYFSLGSILEEQKMVRAFGADYLAYRKTVPWLIPFLRRGRLSLLAAEAGRRGGRAQSL